VSGAADFEGLLRSALRFTPSRARVTVRHEHRLGGPSHFYESVYVNFVNLPEGAGGGGGGAEAENNRMSFWIHGFYGAEPHASPPSGKVKIEHANSALPREYRLRGKTGKPEVIAKYLADFLNRVVAEVPPRWTHTSPTGAAKHESGGNPRTTRSKRPKARFESGEFVKNVRVTKTPDFEPVATGTLAKIIRQDKESGRYFVLWTWNQKTGWYEEDLFEPADMGGGAGARHERGGNPHTASKHHPSLMGFRSPPKEIAHGFKMRVVLGAKDAGLSAGKMSHRNVLVSWRKSSLYSIPIHAGTDTIGFAQLYIHEDGSSYEQLTTANRAETYSTLDFGWLASKGAQFRGLGRAGGAVSVKDAALKAKVKALVGGKK